MKFFCNKCKKQGKNFFYPYSTTKCKECICLDTKIRQSKYRMDPVRVEKQRIYYKKWYLKNGRPRSRRELNDNMEWQKNNREKDNAAHILSYNTRIGKIKRPTVCSVCNKKGKIYGHHEDYSKRLDVIWVCGSCHKNIHYLFHNLTQ